MPDLFALSWLAPTLPIVAALWLGISYLLGINRGEPGERHTAQIATGTALVVLVTLLLLDGIALITGAPGRIAIGDWFHSGSMRFELVLLLDSYALLVSTLVAAVSLLVLRFSVNYLHREPGFQRFFLLMSLFSGGMLLIILGGSALLTFVGWELAGVSSYLLIGYAYDRDVATVNANRAFVTNRIGDAGFILGMFLTLTWLDTLDWQAIQAGASSLSTVHATLIAGSFLVAALAKSAQLPFAGWIGGALEGPTPSSAIFYGAVMVHAGVFLLIRLQPVLEQTPVLMLGLIILGLLSTLYGWLGALVQTDVKSSLMFSTTAQVGLMITACGLGWFDLAAWYLVLHMMWRTYQFLQAPGLVNQVTQPQRPIPGFLASNKVLYNAALRRFWLDAIGDALLVKPTRSLSTDLQNFDDKVVNRMVGLPSRCNAVADMEACDSGTRIAPEGDVGHGRGIAGHVMESLASAMHWFEKHLILKGGGEGLVAAIQRIGAYALQVEKLLAQPRYLVLLIAATFVVII